MTFIRYAGHRYPVTMLSRMRYTYKKRLLPQPFSYSKSLAFSLDTGFHLAMMPGDDFKPGGNFFPSLGYSLSLEKIIYSFSFQVKKNRFPEFRTFWEGKSANIYSRSSYHVRPRILRKHALFLHFQGMHGMPCWAREENPRFRMP